MGATDQAVVETAADAFNAHDLKQLGLAPETASGP
jgi:hypothetical protein